MEVNKEKRLIVAKRIQLKFVSELLASCFLLILFSSVFVMLIMTEILTLIIIFGLILIACAVFFFFHLKNIYINNHSEAILITYKDNAFTIVDDVIEKSKIIDLSYKIEKSFVYTPYFFRETVYNYGKFYVYFQDGDEEMKMTIYNVAEPDKVFDKMVDILEWNTLEE